MSMYLVRYAHEPEEDWTEVEVDDDAGDHEAAQVFAEIKWAPRDGPGTTEVDVRLVGGEYTTRFRVYVEATWTYTAYEISAEKVEGGKHE